MICNNAQCTCICIAPQTLAVSIDVDYTPPADSVLGPNEYRAASSVVLTCIVEGQEGPVNYTWDSTLAVGESPNQRTRNALGSDDTGTHTCNVTEDAINFESASIEINVVGKFDRCVDTDYLFMSISGYSFAIIIEFA